MSLTWICRRRNLLENRTLGVNMKNLKFPKLFKVAISRSNETTNAPEIHRSSFFSLRFALVLALMSLGLPMSVGSASTSALRPVLTSMPIAKSGKPYTFALVATGGTKPYRCAPVSLGVGSLKLTSACVISGTAPTVLHESFTGPFTFKLTDSSKPPQTIEFTGVTVVTKSAPVTPQSFDGTYTTHWIGSITVDPHTANDSPITVPFPSNNGNVVVVNGSVTGNPISITNSELGTGQTKVPFVFDGVTMSTTFSFNLSLTGFAASVNGIGSIHGVVKGTPATITGSWTVIGQRTSTAP